MILMVPVTLFLFSKASEKIIPKQLFLAITLILFFLAIKRPFKQILFTSDSKMSLDLLWKAARSPRITMSIFYKEDRNLSTAATEFAQSTSPGKSFASIRQPSADRDRYASSSFITDFCHGKYYGQVDSLNDPQLLEKKIDYVIVYDQSDSPKLIDIK
jgi:hypothetical protein